MRFAGAARRRIAQYGESVELVNIDREIDPSDDWGDAIESETTAEVSMYIESTNQATIETTEVEVTVNTDAVGAFAASELPDDFDVREADRATEVAAPRGRRYRVTRARLAPNEIYELRLERI